MKKLFLLILILFIFSCSKEISPEEKIKQALEEYLFKTINDPSSYEFVEIGKIDTISKIEHYKWIYNFNMKMYKSIEERNEEYINGYKKLLAKYKKQSEKYTNEIKEIKKEIDSLEKLEFGVEEMDQHNKLIASTKENEIHQLKTTYKFRANNKMGGKILYEYNVILSDSLIVKEFVPVEFDDFN
jgi:peptidoglycan hydrolase CwlO-like protein